MLCPALIHPEQKCALPMAPEFITPQDTEKMGQNKRLYTYKLYKNAPLNADADAPLINYFEMQVENEKGKIIYKNSWITNHKIDKTNIHKIARMGRDRWKIENEAFNILKTKGYNLEHNFGHGKKNLAKVLACFNLLAFLVHHLMSLHDKLYQTARSHFGARIRFFQALSVVTSIQIFESWEHLLAFMSDVFARGKI